MIRRDFLKTIGAVTAGAALGLPAAEAAAKTAQTAASAALPDEKTSLNDLRLPIRSLKPRTSRQITVVVIGAGNRGNVYAGYFKQYPESVKVVGVSDILEHRCRRMADAHGVPPEHRFGDWSEVFKVPKFADAVVVSTPDDVHYAPCMKALEMGYDVLLEKPVSPTERECKNILKQAHKYNKIVAVCHVLRYAPYFLALREVVRSGAIGELVSIQHMEPIQYAHMAHSYVRGNWRNSKQTTPIILAKSCHDLDILRWIIDKPCKTIVADGSLRLFKPENAPEGAPLKCTDGCPHADECPYNAITSLRQLCPLRVPLRQRPARPLRLRNGIRGRRDGGFLDGGLLSLWRPQDPHHGHHGVYRRRRHHIHPVGLQDPHSQGLEP